MLHLESRPQPPPPLRALVVGGEHAYIQGTYATGLRNLHRDGRPIEVTWHWAWKTKIGTRIPAGCDLVLVCTDMCGHGHSQSATVLAKSANVPIHLVTRKFVQTAERLAVHGFAPAPQPLRPEPAPMQSPVPTPTVLKRSLSTTPAERLPGFASKRPSEVAAATPAPAPAPALPTRTRLSDMKNAFVERYVLRDPCGSYAEIETAFLAYIERKYPGIKDGLMVDSGVKKRARTQAGIFVFSRGKGTSDVHIFANTYVAACKAAGIDPAPGRAILHFGPVPAVVPSTPEAFSYIPTIPTLDAPAPTGYAPPAPVPVVAPPPSAAAAITALHATMFANPPSPPPPPAPGPVGPPAASPSSPPPSIAPLTLLQQLAAFVAAARAADFVGVIEVNLASGSMSGDREEVVVVRKRANIDPV